jgi:gliding motility-associated-like protein
VYAQKEGNNWFFGTKTDGLTFNTNPPTLLTGGKLESGREPTIMSDECGRLLFYSEGISVYTADHQVMKNGQDIELNRDNLQRAVAVPYPDRDSVYVLFTAGSIDYSGTALPKLSYSVIDMRLENGKGAVTTRKRFLYDINSTQMTAVRHANGRDFWLLAAQTDEDFLNVEKNNCLLVFLVSPAGVNPQPIVNRVDGLVFSISLFRMRASPDNRKLIVGGFPAVPDPGNDVGEGFLLDFDNATGKVTRTTRVPGGGFGLDYDFSPDSKKIYAGFSDGVFQFQIDRPSGAEIAKTRTKVTNSRQLFSMRLAPDKRIYVATSGSILDVITNPDAIGTAVQYQRDAFRVGDTGNLPNNVASFTLGKQKDFQAKALCVGQPVSFTPQVNYRVVQWQWNFGDPASGAANESNEQSPTHTFSAAGTYRVRMVTLNRCQEYDTVTKAITVYPDPLQSLPDSVEVCFSEAPVSFTAQDYPLTRYRWNTGDSTLTVKATRTGWYRITAGNPCATRSDSVFLRVIPKARALIADDTVFCAGVPAVIDAGFDGATYLWSIGETTRTVSIADSGRYWVRITNRCSVAVDSFRVVFVPQDISAIIPNVFTPNGDGTNDRFENYTLNRNYRLVVCNRWGRIVYQTRQPLAYWDGQVNGLPAEAGIYFYAITATDCRGNPVTYKGHLSLLR